MYNALKQVRLWFTRYVEPWTKNVVQVLLSELKLLMYKNCIFSIKLLHAFHMLFFRYSKFSISAFQRKSRISYFFMLQHKIKRISAAKNIKQKDFLETLTWGELQEVRDRADMQESREKGKKIISQRSNCVWNHHRRWNLPFRSLPMTLTQHLSPR